MPVITGTSAKRGDVDASGRAGLGRKGSTEGEGHHWRGTGGVDCGTGGGVFIDASAVGEGRRREPKVAPVRGATSLSGLSGTLWGASTILGAARRAGAGLPVVDLAGVADEGAGRLDRLGRARAAAEPAADTPRVSAWAEESTLLGTSTEQVSGRAVVAHAA